jgi:hypothetical protein
MVCMHLRIIESKALITKTSVLPNRRRRQSAYRILRKRGLSRWQIIQYTFKNRVQRKGLRGAILETAMALVQDSFRLVLGLTLRVFVFLPAVLMFRIVRLISGLHKKKANSPKEA